MAEITPVSTIDGFVSVDLAAQAAGIPWQAMQQFAVAFAKGRTDPWLGAVLEVRTAKVLGRKVREIRVASLPAAVRMALAGDPFRFLLAAEQVEPGAELTPPDFLLLHRAVQSGICPEHVLRPMLAALLAGGPLLAARRENLDCVLDCFYGWGFRDERLPGVSADYRDFLDRARRQLGVSDRYYATVLIELAGVERPAQIDGVGFIRVVDHFLQLGLESPPPQRKILDRNAVGMIHEARHQLGIGQTAHEDNLAAIGGGVVRTRYLDARGFYRLQAAYMAHGYVIRQPVPRMPAAPGYITQAQANLIWRLWCDRGGTDDPGALDDWIGYVGGLATLTAAGAGRLIDELLEPAIRQRLAAGRPQT